MEKLKSSTLELICGTCGKSFQKEKREHKRQTNKGRTVFYCDRRCSGKNEDNIKRITETRDPKYNFKGGENKLITEDDLIRSSMREFIRRIKNRSKDKNKDFDIDIDHLVDIWKSQNGLCIYTGVKLVTPRDHNYNIVSNNYKCSIDRKDSSEWYIKGNIQFVSCTMNYLKNTMTDEQVSEFVSLIKNNEVSFYLQNN